MYPQAKFYNCRTMRSVNVAVYVYCTFGPCEVLFKILPLIFNFFLIYFLFCGFCGFAWIEEILKITKIIGDRNLIICC